MSDSLSAGAVIVEGLHEIVWVRGPDTVRFLDGLISQDIAGMAEGTVAHSFLLAPNGKLRAPHVVWRGDDAAGLVTWSGGGEVISHDLTRFKIRVDATIEFEAGPVLTVLGDAAREVIATAGYQVPEPNSWVAGDVTVGSVPFARGGPDRFVVVGADADRLAAAGGVAVDRASVEALRIERGEPIVGKDVDESTIPQEMGAVDHAVSFTKGCYLGQELVARIDSRGHVNKHLRGLVIDGHSMPVAGAEVIAGDALVGTLTSVAVSSELDAPVALAMIRREVAPGDDVSVRWDGHEVDANVRELPLV